METKILPIPLIEGHLEPVILKNGKPSKSRKVWVEKVVANTQECARFTIKAYGKTLEVYIPVANMEESELYDFHRGAVYTETGEKVMGIWRWGNTGSVNHVQPLLYDWKKNMLVEIDDYHDGNIRNQHRYLIGIAG